ncbi:hypothetical protein ACI7RC_00415 [Brevibacillus sp. B_LB10_24]|uniref:hypothetical protein n=1 Tax=Brevibacillus sp. B_LB10_24 TaxID=3380645 RepID=UPI0038B98937
MIRRKVIGIIVAVVFVAILTGCFGTDTKPVTEKQAEELGFPVFLPDYLPEGLELKDKTIEENSLFVSFGSGDHYMEITQRKRSKYNYHHMIEMNASDAANKADPAKDPAIEYRIIGNFVGEIDKTIKKQGIFSYTFLPSQILDQTVNVGDLHYYHIQSNLGEDEITQVIESLRDLCQPQPDSGQEKAS